MKELDVICIGEALVDFMPLNGANRYEAKPGGAPANVAAALAFQGCKVGFIGKLGNDYFGDFIEKSLKNKNIEVLCSSRTRNAMTTMAFVSLDELGERSFTFARKPGADLMLTVDDIKESMVENTKILHCGSLSLSESPSRDACIYAMQTWSRMGKAVSFDINYRSAIMGLEKTSSLVDMAMHMIDFLKISDEEEFFVGGADNIENYMRTYNVKIIVETKGAGGADYHFLWNGQYKTGHVDGVREMVVNATGAGDAFWGGFLSKLCQADNFDKNRITEDMVIEAVKEGNKLGALCVTQEDSML